MLQSEQQTNSGSTGNIYSGSSSPQADTDEVLSNFQLPAGWRTQVDEDTGLPCYINIVTGAKVFQNVCFLFVHSCSCVMSAVNVS